MARGWESKSVESQMEEAAETRRAAAQHVPLTPDQIRVARERESLELSRKRVLQEIEAAKHIRHQLQLEAALKHLDQRLRELAS
jgi:hypothetical protein